MSETFDKEAEKEKLRQQLAEEEADREATQRMSELLLKGATMTNRHCSECGDPLFRHEGREFCPTCGRERKPAAAADAPAGDDGGQSATAGAQTVETEEPTEAADRPERGPSGQPTPRATPAVEDGAADLPAARAALARKVTALAREAEATTDVGRARELLAAVREGAEAIRALDGTGRS